MCAVATLGVFSIPATVTACSHLEHITLAWPYADSADVPTDSQLWTTALGGPPRLELVDQTDGAIVALDVTATYRGQDTFTPATHTFTPRALLKPNTTYHVRLAYPGVQRGGAPTAWTFTTAPQPHDAASMLGFDRSGAHVDRRVVDKTTWDTCGCAHDTLYTLTFDHVPADHPVLYTLRADAPEACSQALHTVHVPTSGTMQATLKHMSTSASPEPCLNVTARDPFGRVVELDAICAREADNDASESDPGQDDPTSPTPDADPNAEAGSGCATSPGAPALPASSLWLLASVACAARVRRMRR